MKINLKNVAHFSQVILMSFFHHVYHAFHHVFTIEKPQFRTVFLQNPL
jgi:hypothetical protein